MKLVNKKNTHLKKIKIENNKKIESHTTVQLLEECRTTLTTMSPFD